MAAATLVLLACHGGDDSSDDDGFPPYPRDDELTFADVQALGTHNSYHVETTQLDEWDYTHAPLGEQLGQQGVRQFELDISYDHDANEHLVFHIPVIDEGTTCATLRACLAEQKAWSDDHPGHHPMLTLIEVKEDFDAEIATAYLHDLEAQIREVWPDDRLVTPDLVQGDAASLNEAIATSGWPTLGALRGRSLYVLHTGSDWRRTYTADDTTTAGRVLFPDGHGDLALSVGVVHTLNDPFGDADAIAAAVDAGHLVRTRADTDGDEARAGDTTRRDQALAGGAHFVSTDYPAEREDVDYVVAIPTGTPSRCNPRHAPTDCVAGDIEDPGRLR